MALISDKSFKSVLLKDQTPFVFCCFLHAGVVHKEENSVLRFGAACRFYQSKKELVGMCSLAAVGWRYPCECLTMKC